MPDIHTFLGVDDVNTLAQAIVNTGTEPLLALDRDLRVVGGLCAQGPINRRPSVPKRLRGSQTRAVPCD
jgi:hypothetical protein